MFYLSQKRGSYWPRCKEMLFVKSRPLFLHASQRVAESEDMPAICSCSPIIVNGFTEELRVNVISFEGSGYVESGTDSKITPNSIMLVVEELADQLSLGVKFYIVSYSLGDQTVWSILKYIPHR